eukprot:720074-Amorphochlora_amoeboformis.AAC.1
MDLGPLRSDITCTQNRRIGSSVAMAASFVLQELAHIITGELTYQSQYIGESDAVSQLVEHTYYLLPLVMDAMDNMHYSLLGGSAVYEDEAARTSE